MSNFTTPTLAKKYAIDLAERVGATFVEAFLGTYLASGLFELGGVIDMSAVQKAAFAGIVVSLAVIKGAAAKYLGSRNTAALLPAADDTPRGD